MANADKRCRLSIDIDIDTRQDLDDLHLPWGWKQHVFPRLIQAFINFTRRIGKGRAYLSMLEGKFKIIETEENDGYD